MSETTSRPMIVRILLLMSAIGSVADAQVYKSRITPHWFDQNRRFWYRNDLPQGKREFILVDATKGKRSPAFDHARLAKSLSTASKQKIDPQRLPFSRIEFTAGAIRFRVRNARWKCLLKDYQCVREKEQSSLVRPQDVLIARRPKGDSPWPNGLAPDVAARESRAAVENTLIAFAPRSPNRKWDAYVKNHNVFVKGKDGKEIQLSKDGSENNGYGRLVWSPNSQTLIAFRITPGERKMVHLVESSPRRGGRARLRSRPYALPGDRFTKYELNLFFVDRKKQVKPETDSIDFGFPRLRWKLDKRHFVYRQVDRGHQRLRVVEVDSETGKTRNLIDEKSKTFIWTAHGRRPVLQYFEKTDELIYGSERDGWHHLYLIDGKSGQAKQITKGKFVVRRVDRVDEKARQIWFRASGRNPGEDPYLIHHYRVNFDGTGFTALTEGNGDHFVQFSPDRKYLIDTWSRVDQPPKHSLRRVSDGKRICKLEDADASELFSRGWKPPEVFVAKARDGKTDIWGLIHRPKKIDPKKKYPIIEYIYAGPHGSFVPKSWSTRSRFSSLTDLGFVVVQMDGMGTANRSKAFHDVCWHNLKDAGFPDRVLWIKAAARKYRYLDTKRVGIYGTSAGGQSAMGALLFHGDFYKAAVAACGCHDNRMDKSSWNEQWMGYPVGPQYGKSSNVDNAHKLRGKLLLIVGELDTNVPPESTMRVVDALIKARKDFDLLVMPGMGHSSGGGYGARRLRDFFVRHLQGKEPPDRNAE